MRLIAIVIAGLGAASVVAAQGVEAPKDVVSLPPLVLEVTVRQYAADNRMAASAGDSGTGKFESYVWATGSLCGLGANNSEPTAVPGVGWHFTGEVLGSVREGQTAAVAADQLMVSVEWQRLWENGVRLPNGPKGAQKIALRNGERVELDRVVPAGPSPCGAVDARLEAAIVTRPAYRVTMSNGRLGAVGGGRGGRGVSGGLATGTQTDTAGGRGIGVGAGAGVAGTSAGVSGGRGAAQAGTTTGVSGGRGGGTGGRAATGVGSGTGAGSTGAGGGGRGISSDTTTGAQGRRATADSINRVQNVLRLMTAVRYEAELWLVHREPNGTETVQQQTVQFGGSVATYAFPPIQVSTARGTITLDITGKLQAFVGDPPDPNQLDSRVVLLRTALSSSGSDPRQAQRIMLSISRRARAAGSPLLDITGGSSMAMDMPAPTDVLSFEFPALQKATEDLLKGHQFSLRVRLKPVAK